MLRYWSTHCWNAPDVKVQEAEESKLSKSAEDRDEADDDEDVQGSCISHLMTMMKLHCLRYYDADFKRCCDDEHEASLVV